MAKFNLHSEFGSQTPQKTADAQICARIEALLPDAADGSLDPELQAIFDAHIATCVRCSLMLADARRGAAWLEMLKSQAPEPPRDMVSRILAQTSLAQISLAQTGLTQPGVQTAVQRSAPATGVSIADTTFANQPGLVANLPIGIGADLSSLRATGSTLAGSIPGLLGGSALQPSANVLPFRARVAAGLGALRSWKQSGRHTVFQPRLAMTAAMAFFSVALTLDVTGIHLNQLRASELRPSNLKRSFYAANAHVARYYDNLRVVYELESRVHDLQRSSAGDSPREQAPSQPADTQPDSQPQSPSQTRPENHGQPDAPRRKQSHPAPNSGTSRHNPGGSQVDPSGQNSFVGQQENRTSQHPSILALANLPFPLRASTSAHNPPPASQRPASPIAAAPAPKERGDLA